jgi:acetyl esterase/lipase
METSIQWRHHVSLRTGALNFMNRVLLEPRFGRLRFDDPRHLQGLARLDQQARWIRTLPGTQVEPVKIGEFAAEWIQARGVEAERDGEIVLYFHGGGWFFCGLNTHRRGLTRLSAATGRPVLSVDYRMMPEVDFQTMVKDCLDAYRWLLDDGVQPAHIVVAGDSAGGHLAFAVVVHARQQGWPTPGCVIGLSPCLDLDFAAKFAHRNASLNTMASATALRELHRVFLSGLDASDPLVSPVHADLRGFPPVMLIASSTEMLLCDSELMADRLAAAGVEHTLVVYRQQPHAFPALGHLTPESKAAVGEIGEFVRQHSEVRKLL